MKKTIFIRVDGSSKYGLGHLIRCIALAKMFIDNFKIVFVSKVLPETFKEKFSCLFEFLSIKYEEEFYTYLNEKSIIVVDGYQFDRQFYESLRRIDCKVVSIQDINFFTENIDLVLNHLPEVENNYPNIDCLCGPEYAILREEFLMEREVFNDLNKNYFISLGGTSNAALVNQIIKLINQIRPEMRIDILTTDENKKRIKGKNYDLHVNKSAEEIVKLIDSAAICFITSGMISYEVLSRNKRAIIGALNSGQEDIGQRFRDLGLAENVGFWKDITEAKLIEAMNFRNIKPDKVKEIFDGKSGERILNKFLQL